MSNFKRGFFQLTILSFVCFLFFFSVMAHVLDQKHSETPCADWEREYWQGEGETYFHYGRVSSFFWSSLCGDVVPPVVFSASEGTVQPTFVSYLGDVYAREFTGSHRGVKTFGYLAAHKIHPDRLRNLRVLLFVNPVYFSFAASTDAASIRLNAISTLSYALNVPSLKQKWDAFVLDWFYIGTKSYFHEWALLHDPPLESRPDLMDADLDQAEEYDFDRNMYTERAEEFTSFRSRFGPDEEPTRTLFNQSMTFIREHPEVPVCVVLLPINVKNLRHFKRDDQAVVAGMNKLFAEIPAGKGLNLLDMNEATELFMDPMHFTPHGVAEIMKRVRASDCAAPVLAKAAP